MDPISILQAIILGGVQGAAEFLPVSSSGHLIIAADFLNIPVDLAAETLLNFGTIAVILIFFWRQIWAVICDVVGRGLGLKEKRDIIAKLSIGVVPALLVGLAFGDFIERYLHGTETVVVMLVLVAIPMILVKPKKLTEKKMNTNIVQEISYKQALAIGLMQPLALISGTSRSGITILTGLIVGLSVEAAAAFSFLIGLPVILGATLKLMVSDEGRYFLENNFDAFLAGNIASFLVGLLAVFILMDIVKRKGLRPFGVYRIVLAIAVALFVLL
jgi:undecaprenyl-diphosphatase